MMVDTRLRLHNSGPATLRILLEPWGDQYTMQPDDLFEVEAKGPAGDRLEVAVAPGTVTIYGWPGAMVRVLHNGRDLDTSG
ncbi:MAG TPA: hypothetical protein VM536_04875 [Chloroflexia bacterium]|nr:hypothetical protein [Chloroflexia bacterium]